MCAYRKKGGSGKRKEKKKNYLRNGIVFVLVLITGATTELMLLPLLLL